MTDNILNQLEVMTKIIEKKENQKTEKILLKEGSTESTMKRFEKNYSEYRKVFDYLKDK